MFVGYTNTVSQYRLYDPMEKKFLISRQVGFEESTSYYQLETLERAHRQRYYVPVIQQWEEHLAWNDEFNEQEESAMREAIVQKELAFETQLQKEVEEEVEGNLGLETARVPPGPLQNLSESRRGGASGANPSGLNVLEVRTRCNMHT